MSNKLNQEELLEELKQMEVDEEEIHKGSLEVPGVNTKLMNQIHQKRKQAYQQTREVIQKPGVTEEWIKEKAIELINLVGYRITGEYARHHLISVQDFIRSLIKEIV